MERLFIPAIVLLLPSGLPHVGKRTSQAYAPPPGHGFLSATQAAKIPTQPPFPELPRERNEPPRREAVVNVEIRALVYSNPLSSDED